MIAVYAVKDLYDLFLHRDSFWNSKAPMARFCDMGATIDIQPLVRIAGAPGSESFLWE